VAAIPAPINHTVAAIYQAYVESNDNFESIGIPAGSLGKECERAVWYDFRYVSPAENIEGRKIRIFRRGDIEEERIIDDLRAIGVEVTDQQAKCRDVGGHIRGKIDGQALGIPEAPATIHLLECKSSNTKNFKPLKKNGVQAAKPDHYATMQFYMLQRGLDRALYCCVNKDDEDYHIERVRFDVEFALRLVARAKGIIESDEPPARISEKPDFFSCKWCRHHSVCHEGAWARVSCRTCIHSTPTLAGDAAWECARWNKPLGLEEQKAGCPAHLFLPGLVPGRQTDSNADEEWIEYQLPDGSIWRDGGEQKAA
jgi:hypothetical protein